MGNDLSHVDGETLQPEAVREAEQVLRRFGLAVGASVVSLVALYVAMLFFVGPIFPASWWTLALAGAIASYFFPPTRQAQRARELLRRWDEAAARAALEQAGTATEPQLQVAEAMGARILGHPAVDAATGRAVAQLLERLRQAARDQRTLSIMQRADESWPSTAPGPRTLSDLNDYLEARAGRLLGALAEIHSAVVKRDSEGVERVLEEANQILAEVEASNEVDRLLGGGSE